MSKQQKCQFKKYIVAVLLAQTYIFCQLQTHSRGLKWNLLWCAYEKQRDLFYFNYFLFKIVNFLETQLYDIIVDKIFYNEVTPCYNFAVNYDFVCFKIHSICNLSLRSNLKQPQLTNQVSEFQSMTSLQ